MNTSFLHQLFLSKLEEARLYGELLENQLTANEGNQSVLSDKELEKWLVKLNKWQTDTAAFKVHTIRMLLPQSITAEKTSEKISSGKKLLSNLVSTFEGIEVKRQLVNKKGPMLSAGYHSDRQVLDVEFKPGTVYRYYGIPEELYDELINNPRQAMSFFSKNIRNEYDFKQLPS